MAINFWEVQREQRRKTAYYLALFALLTFGIAFLIEFSIYSLDPELYSDGIPFIGFFFLVVTFGTAAFNYFMYLFQGGGYVARQHGGRLVEKTTTNLKEKMLINIAEEVAIASALPVPEVYILDAQMINAFAAGIKQDKAAIAVTKGAINKLSREELQGVVAHEFGHIANQDMRLSLRLAAMVTGFYVVFYLGMRLLQGSSYQGRSRNDKKGGGAALIAIALIVAGAVAWLGGTILKRVISRKREFLADASAVQFTRQSKGIKGALLKIAKEQSMKEDMPNLAGAYSHLYFTHTGFFGSLFATHPPLEERIRVLDGEEK